MLLQDHAGQWLGAVGRAVVTDYEASLALLVLQSNGSHVTGII